MATAAEVQTAYRAIVRTDLNATVAQSIADAINNGTTTIDAYIASLVTQNTTSTGAAVAITAFVTGVAPSSAQLDNLKVAADAQIASYTKLGVANPSLAAFEAFGRGLAVDSSTTAGFNTKYGSLSTADFITSVYFQVYGTNPSAAAAANLTAQINYFTTLYTQNNIPNAALAAKGAVLGQIVGYAFVSDASSVSLLDNQVATLLTSAAKGDTSVYGAALPAASNPGTTFALTTGIDNLVGTAANDIFRADNTTLQAADTINGGAGRDTLQITDASTTGLTIAASVSNVEVINVRNISGTAPTAATFETASFTFADQTAGATVTITPTGGAAVTYTAPGGGATGAQVAAYFSANLPAGYQVASGSGAQLTLRASTAGNAADLALGGTGTGNSVIITQGVDAAAGASIAQVVNAAGFTGATDFNTDVSTGSVTFNNVAQGQSVGVIGNGTAAGGALNANYAGSATSAVLNLAGGTAATGNGAVNIAGSGLTAVTVNSTGGANTLGGLTVGSTVKSLTVNAASNLTTGTLTASGLTSLTASGVASKVTVGQVGTTVTTIDASGLTAGGLTVGLNTGVTSFKGGQGADVVSTAALTATTAGIIDGGAGTDTLVVAGATDLNTAAKAAQYVNFETLRVSNSQDVSLLAGITAVEIDAATSAVISGLTAAQAGAITVRGDQTTALTLTLANATGTSDVVSLKLQNPTETSATKADVDIAGLSVIGVETLNVQNVTGGTSLTDAGTLNSIAFASGGANKLTSINLSGDRSIDLSLTNVENAVTVNNTLSGSAALLVSAGATVAGSVVNGTANADTFVLGTVTGVGVATYNGGAGNDTFTATAANIVGNTIDGGAGTDTLSFTAGTSTLVDAAFQRVTNVEKIAFLATNQATSLTSGGFFDSNFKTGGVEVSATALTSGSTTIDLTSFTGKATVTTGNATATATQSITTGSGDDVISLSGAAASLTASGGAGNDTITINGTAATTAAVATGGAGKDVITFASAIVNGAGAEQITVNVGAGESTKTAYDSVTGFDLGTGALLSSKLDFDGTSTVATNFTASAVTGFTSAELTASSTNGIITFAGSSAAGLTLAQKIEAVDALINTDNATAAFVHNGNTYVFHDSASAGGDSLVELVGVTAASLITTNANTANALFIA